MSKFELSDKELKQLLQNEGLEEPSLSFNRNVLENIAAYEHAKSIKTPFALKALFTVLMLIPLVLIFMNGGVDLGMNETLQDQGFNLPSPDIDFEINKNYIYFSALLVGVSWLAVFFNKLINKENNTHG